MSRLLRSLLVAGLATLLSAVALRAADPSGTWKFTAEGPNGRSIESTLKLSWQNNQLTGTVDNRTGEVQIRDGKFADDRVSFTVVREVGRAFRKRTFTIRYSGKLEGDTIKGTLETTGREDKPISLPWEAKRSS